MEDYRLALLIEEQLKYEKQKQQIADYELAQELQKEFESDFFEETPPSDKKCTPAKHEDHRSLVDPSWELVDPSPNIHTLFVAFDKQFFWSTLGAVSVDWSKRMTSCAGICYYHARAGRCNITLSEPLLKLRPRSDLVETLLHEMIHAYLFVTHNNRDRDGHGPEFHKHMYRINGLAGTNITVYHSFHNEVRLYQQHWWKCNGPCQFRRPFYGIVRRAMNRAPGPYDRWWSEHQYSCGGTFIKVKEPEKKPKGKDAKNKKGNGASIKDYFVPKNSSNDNKDNVKRNVFDNEKTQNIAGFHKTSQESSTVDLFKGSGNFLNKPTTSSSDQDYSVVRNHWVNKFPNSIIKRRGPPVDNVKNKIQKDLNGQTPIKCPLCSKEFMEGILNNHLDVCLSTEFIECDICDEIISTSELEAHKSKCYQNSSQMISTNDIKQCPICNTKISEIIFDSHLAECAIKGFDSLDADLNSQETLECVQCLVCNKKILKSDLGNHLNDCITDEMIFNDENRPEIDSNLEKKGVSAHISKNDSLNETIENCKVKCPVCDEDYQANEIQGHVNLCLGDWD